MKIENLYCEEEQIVCCKLTSCPILRWDSVGILLTWIKNWTWRLQAMCTICYNWWWSTKWKTVSAIAYRQCWGKKVKESIWKWTKLRLFMDFFNLKRHISFFIKECVDVPHGHFFFIGVNHAVLWPLFETIATAWCLGGFLWGGRALALKHF